MISRVQGTILTREGSRVEVETQSGVVYEIEVPLTVLQRLPDAGEMVELRTVQIVTESSVALYGFLSLHERSLFQRLLTANGVGPKLALSMMSTYSAERLARALIDKDTAALVQIPGIGKKTAEKLALELSDRVSDLAFITPAERTGAGVAQEAVQALIALGFTFGDADLAVRAALKAGTPKTAEELIRRALAG
jgi:Holliday junction DNA helicase RuvA